MLHEQVGKFLQNTTALEVIHTLPCRECDLSGIDSRIDICYACNRNVVSDKRTVRGVIHLESMLLSVKLSQLVKVTTYLLFAAFRINKSIVNKKLLW